MVEKNHPSLSVGAQCRLLSISRSSFYCAPQGETAMNLDLMLLIDKQFLDPPFYGVRQRTWHLQNEGHAVNQKRIRRLMRLMRLMPIDQKPDTSRPAKAHKTSPDLLGGLRVDRPNQVWCADITDIPMHRGFLYLVAVMDWLTRKVLAWRIANTREADFCVEALNEAIHKFGPPEIMNMEHGRAIGSSGHATSGQPGHALRLDRPAEAGWHPDLPLGDCLQSPACNGWTARGAAATTSSSSASGGP
jgi:putative transposase